MERRFLVTMQILFVLILVLRGLESHAQTVSVKNNIAYDATLTPNLGVEVAMDSVWSLGGEIGFRPWPFSDKTTRKYRHLLIAPEVRRYFSRVGEGHFAGASVVYTHYNVGGVTLPFGLYPSVKRKRKEGDALAIGPFYGYAWRIDRHWRFEAAAGFALGYAWYDAYQCGHCGTRTGSESGVFLMPRVAVNAVYTIGGKDKKAGSTNDQ